jgi:hypothetical protein
MRKYIKVTYEIWKGAVTEVRKFPYLDGTIARMVLIEMDVLIRSSMNVQDGVNRVSSSKVRMWQIYAPGKRGRFIGLYNEKWNILNVVLGMAINADGIKYQETKEAHIPVNGNLESAVKLAYMKWSERRTKRKKYKKLSVAA